MKKGLIFIALLGMMACDKEEVPVDETNGKQNQVNRTLTIEVQHRYNQSPVQDSALNNASVKVYLDPSDRASNNNQYIVYERFTGANGSVRLEFLMDTTYYIRVAHPTLSLQQDRNVDITTTAAFEYFVLQ